MTAPLLMAPDSEFTVPAPAEETPATTVPRDIFKRKRGHDLIVAIAEDFEEFLDVTRHDNYDARMAGIYDILAQAFSKGLNRPDLAFPYIQERNRHIDEGRRPTKLRHVPPRAERRQQRIDAGLAPDEE